MPPELGGATPGGVATHQAALAAGLAAACPTRLSVNLLATSASLSRPSGWRRRIQVPPPPDGDAAHPADAPDRGDAARGGAVETPGYTLFRHYVPPDPAAWLSPAYLRRVGPARLLRYATILTGMSPQGSRRETLANLLWYQRFLDTVQPDVVHVQHPLERLRYLRLLARLERRQRRPPLVVTAHSFFGEHPAHVIERLMAPGLAAAARVIAVSPHIADQAVQLGVDAHRVRVIRSGVNTQRFRPRDPDQARQARQELGLDPDRPLVLFVGNLEPRKRVDLLLRALARVRHDLPGLDPRLAIVGSGVNAGADDQTDALQRLSRDLELARSVEFVGSVSSDQLLCWYAAADVFALPSSSEAQGIVALEAMACGLAVVASAVGGLLGTIEDSQSGVLVPAGQVEPLAQALSRLLQEPSTRHRLGAAARERVVRDFSWSRAAAATLDVYRELTACPDGCW